MNIISSAHFKETQTSPAAMYWPRCVLSKGSFLLLSTERGDCSPGTVPGVIQTATYNFSFPVIGALVVAGGVSSAPLGVCAKCSGLCLGRQIMPVLSSVGSSVSIDICVSTLWSPRGIKAEKTCPPHCLCAQTEQNGCKSGG